MDSDLAAVTTGELSDNLVTLLTTSVLFVIAFQG